MKTTDLGKQHPEPGSIMRTTSAELLGGHNQLVIEHNGAHYTLRITTNNKLILTK